jgi:hypothetical protein
MLVLVLLTCSCNLQQSKELQKALELAGNNRTELRSVLDHYSQNASDSLKYRAACFLIENMPYYHFYEGELLSNYLNIYETIAISSKEPTAIMDSFIKNYGHFSYNMLTVKSDVSEIKSEFLISNIEYAFKVWREQPWGKNVSFSDFCEYILPYRIGDEQPSGWRERMYRKYNSLLDPYRDSPRASDPLFAARIILDSLSKGEKHFTTILPNLPHIGPKLCEQWRTGSCRELTDLTVYVLRSLGIPCGVDFMPIHARGNAGHFWTFILDIDGNTYTSDYLDGNILNSHECQHFTSKIYRRQFSINRQLEKELTEKSFSIPDFFRYPRFKDVTAFYKGKNPLSDIYIPDSLLYSPTNKPDILYLCASRKMDWIPVDWTKTNGKPIHFKNVKSDIIFRIGGWKNNQMEFYTDPISSSVLDAKLHVLKAEQKKEDMCLLSKYEIYDTEGFTRLMVNGTFEASNNNLFSPFDTLFVITKAPERLKNTIYINPTQAYRYFRYHSPENSHCDVAEIMFFQNTADTNPVKGEIIGTENNQDQNSRNELPSAFDNNPYTSFHYQNPSGGWAGMDFDKKISISKITYIPRNRDNFIREGDQYELFYFDNHWISAGLKTAESDSLMYNYIPANALLYLRNHTRGNDERIFTYENGKQHWW